MPSKSATLTRLPALSGRKSAATACPRCLKRSEAANVSGESLVINAQLRAIRVSDSVNLRNQHIDLQIKIIGLWLL